MRLLSRTACLLAGVSAVLALAPRPQAAAQEAPAQQAPAQSQAQANRPIRFEAWAPKPAALTAWVAPNRPHWKLTEILAKHAGQKDWVEDIVSDKDFVAKYISMGPGEKTKTQFYADNRVFWVVQDGQIRVQIEGQPAFVASKGFLVQVPFRTQYSLETVGDKPSLRFEVTAARDTPAYPLSETPAPVAGKHYVKVMTWGGQGTYDKINKPYVDFQKSVVEANTHGGSFVEDAHTFANMIRGRGAPTPPATDLGHFHVDYNEFWFVLEGKITYQIEGVPLFTAEEGDIVYAPEGRWHRASFAGDGMSTRLAINPRPQGMHDFQAPD